MPKIAILGSCKYEPYEVILVPKKISDNTEEGYKIAIDKADEVWVYIPEGMGKHTARDFNYALSKKKKVYVLVSLEKLNTWQRIIETLLNILTRTWLDLIRKLEEIKDIL